MHRRSPHGERGLKLLAKHHQKKRRRRSPHGERGLKLGDTDTATEASQRRSPHGERGLK